MMTTGVFDDQRESRAKQSQLEVWKRAVLADGWQLPPEKVRVNWDDASASRPNWADVGQWRDQKRASALLEVTERGKAGGKVRRIDSLDFDEAEGTLPEPKRRKVFLRISKKDGATVPKSGVEAEPVRQAEAAKNDETPKIILKLRNPKAAKKHPHPLEEAGPIGEPVLERIAKPDSPVPAPGERSTRTSVRGSARMKEKREAYLAKKHGG
ncbi:hypothetical protein BST61_g2795 [Cercospora zeina]